MPCGLILVSRNETHRISVGYCGVAVGTFIETREGKYPSRLWCRHHSRVLVGNLHISQRNLVGAARTVGHEDEVRDLEKGMTKAQILCKKHNLLDGTRTRTQLIVEQMDEAKINLMDTRNHQSIHSFIPIDSTRGLTQIGVV